MPKDKFKGSGVLVKGDWLTQSFNFLHGFGLPVNTDPTMETSNARNDPDKTIVRAEILSIKKKIGSGSVTQTYLPGNEGDQYRVYISLVRRAKKNKDGDWMASYKSYRSLAVEAFGTLDPTKEQIRRAEYALVDLTIRSVKFKKSFREKDASGKIIVVDRSVKIPLLYEHEDCIYEDEEEGYVEVILNPKLMGHHLGDITARLSLSVLDTFKNDQFTRQFYQYLTVLFFNKGNNVKLYARNLSTILEEFGLKNSGSHYEQGFALRRRLKDAINKINKGLENSGYGFMFSVRFEENNKISFIKFRVKRDKKRKRVKLKE